MANYSTSQLPYYQLPLVRNWTSSKTGETMFTDMQLTYCDCNMCSLPTGCFCKQHKLRSKIRLTCSCCRNSCHFCWCKQQTHRNILHKHLYYHEYYSLLLLLLLTSSCSGSYTSNFRSLALHAGDGGITWHGIIPSSPAWSLSEEQDYKCSKYMTQTNIRIKNSLSNCT